MYDAGSTIGAFTLFPKKQIDGKNNIKFYLPFDNFESKPDFKDINEYLIYKEKTLEFITARNKRIEKAIESRMS